MMQTHLDDPVYIQTGNPTTRTVNPGKQMRKRKKKSPLTSTVLFSGTKQTHKCSSFSNLTDLQCMMEEWCSPYSSWLSLIKGCSADRPPPSDPPPQLLLFEEGDSGVSLEISAAGSASAVSPFFSSVWRKHKQMLSMCKLSTSSPSKQCQQPHFKHKQSIWTE